jgi:hypothetical protein
VNDNFSAASAVTGSSWTSSGSNVDATSESGEPAHAGQTTAKSVWFSWTAPSSGSATIGTAGSAFDTVLAVYTGSSVGALTAVASNDDRTTGVTDSQVTFQAVAGTIYRIAVDGKSGASGSLTITGSVSGVSVANDAFASALVCSGTTFNMTGSNVGATKEAGEPSHAGQAGGKSIWYYWVAPANGKLTLATTGSNFDTLLGVYTGSAVNALKVVASNDDVSRIDKTSKVIFSVTAGTKYWIAVDGYLGASGSVRLAGSYAATKVLASPTGLAAKQDSAGRVQITWLPVAEAASYDVILSSGSTVMVSGRVTSTAVKTVGSLSRSLPLTVNVRAFTADDEPGLWSGEKTVAK